MGRKYDVRANKSFFGNRFLYRNDHQEDMIKMSGNMNIAREALRQRPNRALAIGRTVLANDRTLLSSLRTFLSFLAAGFTIIILMEHPLIDAVGWVLVLVAALFLFLGIKRYFAVNKLLTGFAQESSKEKDSDLHL